MTSFRWTRGSIDFSSQGGKRRAGSRLGRGAFPGRIFTQYGSGAVLPEDSRSASLLGLLEMKRLSFLDREFRKGVNLLPWAKGAIRALLAAALVQIFPLGAAAQGKYETIKNIEIGLSGTTMMHVDVVHPIEKPASLLPAVFVM